MNIHHHSIRPPARACACRPVQLIGGTINVFRLDRRDRPITRQLPRHHEQSVAHGVTAVEISRQFVRQKNPCADGFRWFIRHCRDGSDYQPLLDALVAAGRVADACWLMDQFGPTRSVLEVDALEADAVVFAGSLHVRGPIDVDTVLRVGGALRAASGLRVGRRLQVGEDLWAAGNVHSQGCLQVDGDVRADWNLWVEEQLDCGGDLRVGWDVEVGTDCRIGGQTAVGGDVTVGDSLKCLSNLRLRGALKVGGSAWSAQGIEVNQGIDVSEHLEACWGIVSGKSIVAGGSIKAGESLAAEEIIQSGDGYGIYAGLNVPMDVWEASAWVRARELPKRLFSGYWHAPATP